MIRWRFIATAGLLLAGVLPAHAEPVSLSNALFPRSNSVDASLRDTPGRSGDPNMFAEHLRGTFIVSKSSEGTWFVRESAGQLEMNHAPVVAETGLVIPTKLWDVETGGGYQRRISERRDWSISGSVGSASDKPFNSIHETVLRATGSYRIPSKESNSWLFLLSYSNNRHFANNIPLPGVAYVIHSPKNGVDAVLGIPFLAINYAPTKLWNARFSAFGPDNFSAEMSRTLKKEMQAYAGFDWSQEVWLRAHRADNSNRLFYDEKKWSLGLRFPIVDAVKMDLGTSYGFHRRFYENDKAASDVPTAALDSAWSFLIKVVVKL